MFAVLRMIIPGQEPVVTHFNPERVERIVSLTPHLRDLLQYPESAKSAIVVSEGDSTETLPCAQSAAAVDRECSRALRMRTAS